MTWQASGYRHRQELGGGKTGRAWLAVEESSGELVVIKYLNISETYYSDVEVELERLSALDAAYYVRIRTVVRETEGIAVVMDPVNGAQLRALIRDDGALGAEAALLVYRDSLTALGSSVHGDYRPENVIVSASGNSLLMDTRMAAWVQRDVTLSTGVYLAPERWHAAELTAAADVYAATVTYYELLVGEPPYWEESQLLALRYAHESAEVPVEACPEGVRDLVRVGLAKEAGDRLDVAGLLLLIEGIAISEYGADWEAVGRAQLVERVSRQSLLFAEETGVAAVGIVRDTEDESNDDFYAAGAVVAGGVALGALAGVAAAETVEVDEVDVAAGAVGVGAAEVDEVDVAAGAVGVGAAETVEVDELDVASAAGAVGVDAVEVDEVDAVAVDEVDVVEVDSAALAVAEAEAIAAAEAEQVQAEEAAAAVALVGVDDTAEVAMGAVGVGGVDDTAEVAMGAVGVGEADEEEDDETTGALPIVVAGGLIAAVAAGDDTGAIGIGGVDDDTVDVGAAGAVGVGAAGAVGVGTAGAVAVGDAGAVAVGTAHPIPTQPGPTAVGEASPVAVGVAGSVGVGEAPVPGGRHKRPEDEKEESWLSRNRWLAILLLLLLLALCAFGVLFWQRSKDTNGPGGPTPSPTATVTGPGGVVGGNCPSPASSPCPTDSAGVPNGGSSSGGTSTGESQSPTPTATPTESPTPTPTPTPTPIPVPTDTHNPCQNPHAHSGHQGSSAIGQDAGTTIGQISEGLLQRRC